MNLKTTLALLVLVGAGVALTYFGLHLPAGWLPGSEVAPAPDAGVRAELKPWEPASLQRIEIQAGDRSTLLERDADGEWNLPGKWNIRKAEVKAVVSLLGNLHSRFEPLPLEGKGTEGRCTSMGWISRW